MEKKEGYEDVEALKKLFRASTDEQLARKLGVFPCHISRWRTRGFPGYVQEIINKKV